MTTFHNPLLFELAAEGLPNPRHREIRMKLPTKIDMETDACWQELANAALGDISFQTNVAWAVKKVYDRQREILEIGYGKAPEEIDSYEANPEARSNQPETMTEDNLSDSSDFSPQSFRRRRFQKVADLNLYNPDGLVDPIGEIKVEEEKLPTFEMLEAAFEHGADTGDFHDFIAYLQTIDNRAANEYISQFIIVEMPQIPKNGKVEIGSKAESELFALWHREFNQARYQADTQKPESTPSADDGFSFAKPTFLRDNLPHPNYAESDKEGYLDALKLYADGFKRWSMKDKIAFRAHRDAIRGAISKEEIAKLAGDFYETTLGVEDHRNTEDGGDYYNGHWNYRASSWHPLYKEKQAIEALFCGDGYKVHAGGAGIKKKPSERRVVLSANQRRLQKLQEIIASNPSFYMYGSRDDDTKVAPKAKTDSRKDSAAIKTRTLKEGNVVSLPETSKKLRSTRQTVIQLQHIVEPRYLTLR